MPTSIALHITAGIPTQWKTSVQSRRIMQLTRFSAITQATFSHIARRYALEERRLKRLILLLFDSMYWKNEDANRCFSTRRHPHFYGRRLTVRCVVIPRPLSFWKEAVFQALFRFLYVFSLRTSAATVIQRKRNMFRGTQMLNIMW